MGKVLAGVVAGYVVMLAVVFGLMTVAWMVLGADGAFRPGTFEVTGTWIAAGIVVALLAAVAGGWTCARITPDPRAIRLLVGLVVVLGVIFAIPVLTAPAGPPAPRPAGLAMMEAMKQGVQPAWVALLNPALGAIGALIGSRLHRRRAAA
jgi:hypothetical protein